MRREGRKNQAGSWLRDKVMGRAMLAMGVTGLLVFPIGVVVASLLPAAALGVVQSWGGLVVLVVAVIVGVWVYLFMRRTERTWVEGLKAERQVGDLIEHALVPPHRAFAHDVKEALGVGGNVDHVVLTPAGVWAVETKAHWLEGDLFQAALRQAAQNAKHVQRHLKSSLAVRAALVLAEDGEYEREYDARGEPVVVFFAQSFRRRLWEECKVDSAHDAGELKEVARQVWNLGSRAHMDQ